MSSDMNAESDTIQHIDDTYEEEYVESFAPKAQEEILSEIQTGDNEQICNQNEDNTVNENDFSKSNVDEVVETSESVDISNEEDINVTSHELVQEVITVVESNLVNNEVDKNEVINEEIKESVDDENSVNVEKLESKHEEESEVIQNVEETEQVTGESDEIEHDNVDEIQIQDTPNTEVVQEEIEHVSEVNEDNKIEEISITETKSMEMSEESEVKQKITYSPTKGKDVKSLSSTYGHEENLTNGDCCICNKKVYPMEKLSTNDKIFHKTCFRCTKCKSALSAGNFTFNHGKPYCTPHYVELFKKRGRYDEIDDNIEKEIPATNDISDILTDELPAPDTTKNILAKFRDLQTTGGNNVSQTINNEPLDELPAPNTTKNLMERFSALGQEKQEGKCKPKIDIPRYTNGHSNGTSENQPIELPGNVVRANDPSHDDRPEQGITKNLVNRFRELEGSVNN